MKKYFVIAAGGLVIIATIVIFAGNEFLKENRARFTSDDDDKFIDEGSGASLATPSTTPLETPKGSRFKIGDSFLRLIIADSEVERQIGLGNRPAIAADAGMLFVFDDDGKYGFWMKDTRFAIDIIWLDRDFRIVDIRASVEPESYPEVFFPRELARYVLEARAGYALENGLVVGQSLEYIE